MFLAVWTPLIIPEDFNGVKADLLTSVSGIVTILIIILGIGILIKVLGR